MTGDDDHTDSDLTLFCLKCDYNLTGIVRNVCPECGCEFDREYVLSRIEYARESFPASKAMLLVSVPAIATMFFLVVLAAAPNVIKAFAGAIMWFSVPYGLILAYYLAWRMRIHRNGKRGISPYARVGRGRFAVDMILVAFAQFVLMVATILLAIPIMMFLQGGWN